MTTIIARTHDDYEAGAAVVREYLRWLRDEQGLDLVARRPRVADEAWRTKAVYGPPHGALLIAFAGSRPAGVVGIAEVAPGVAELRRMYVRPALRARGAGTALLTRAIEDARRRGYGILRLQADPGSVAHRMYRRVGFREGPAWSPGDEPGTVGMALWLASTGPTASTVAGRPASTARPARSAGRRPARIEPTRSAAAA
jgi:GNAT superfamily N-acetyltransferase